MPRRRSIKKIIVESLVFLGLFASLGHMTVNFWERFVIESELVHMKTSLHSLKETITRIGATYDSLHRELRNLIEVEDKQHPARLKNVEYSIRPNQPSLPVPQAVVLKLDKIDKTKPSVAKHDKTTEKQDPTENKKLETLVNNRQLNASTITKNLLRSVRDANMDPIEYERRDIYSINEPQNENQKPETLVNIKLLNAATITRNPLKSVGLGNTNKDPIEYERRDIYSINEPQNKNLKPEALVNTKLLNAATITRNPLKSVGNGNTNKDPIEYERRDIYSINEPQNENQKPEALVNTKLLNAATITRNPLKSVGIGNTNKDPIEYERRDIYSINEPQNENQKPEALVNTKLLNAATITRNPLKSVGVGNTNKDPIKYERRDINSVYEPHNCLYSPEYKYCRRRNQYPYLNWRV